jgi:hypothetical protein
MTRADRIEGVGGYGGTGRAPNASSGSGPGPLFLRGPAPLLLS